MTELLLQWLKDFGLEPEVDFLDRGRECCGLYPQGVQEIGRSADILGNITVVNRYSFLLRAARVRGRDSALWLEELQRSARGVLLPGLGRVRVQKGALAEGDEGLAVYSAQITVEREETV